MQESPFEKLRRLSTGYMQASVLGAAAELDIFSSIMVKKEGAGADEVAQRLQVPPRGLKVLLDSLVAMGFLLKSESAAYTVPEEYNNLLDNAHPDSFIPMLRHMASGQRTWSRLAWSVKDDCPQERTASILGMEEDRVSFIRGMNSIAVSLAGPTVASLLEAEVLSYPGENLNILDIGGASGSYTKAFLEALPKATATIFDLPVGIEEARKRFKGSPLEGRVRLKAGNFMQEPLPAGFNFAWISAIIHSYSREDSVKLYQNSFQALKPGGLVAVRDYIMEPSRTSPLDGALFGINMLVNTPAGRVYTFAEVKDDLEQAGFSNVTLAVPAATMSAVVTAHKA